MNIAVMPVPGRTSRFVNSLPIRLLVAVLCVFVPFLISRIVLGRLTEDHPLLDRAGNLLSATIALAAYYGHARKIEKRAVTELPATASAKQLGRGLLAGGLLFAATIGTLALAGSYHVEAMNAWGAMLPALLLAVSVAILEEVLLRGILFRMTAQSLGSWTALLLSSAVFGLIHLSNQNPSWLGALNAMEAGMLFAALYMVTGSLWLPIGVHAGWNFVQGGVFSVSVSGHAGRGLVQGRLTGPDWLSGGVYGAEASVVALIVVGLVTMAALYAARRPSAAIPGAWRVSKT